MSLTILKRPLFLDFDTVKLGRFTTSFLQPHRGHHMPELPEAPKVIKTPFSLDEHKERDTKATFSTSITSFLSASFSKRSGSELHITPQTNTRYVLDNAEKYFEDAMSTDRTRRWIESAFIRRSKVYLIIGIHTMTDTRIIQGSSHGRQAGADITAAASLLFGAPGIAVPLDGSIEPTVTAEYQDRGRSQSNLFVGGEHVFAVEYLKVSHRWFSSRTADRLQLSSELYWSCLEGKQRDAYVDQEEDLIEVRFEDLGKPDGNWLVERVADQMVCIQE
ncbi:hypothetical protein K431DRAFT_283658 [Polychaeton citri CBS 116435]|uniref:Uncharacterized protein n=1 Tax=Polychaeton citri CBS 116435 TaxID=1314669 RepID=A0A9P4UQG7_9PEZI|nr:hypothetical protein K431DRAFT_283658 [Polychaeton citri CBS 116435]